MLAVVVVVALMVVMALMALQAQQVEEPTRILVALLQTLAQVRAVLAQECQPIGHLEMVHQVL
jgi:hypothetical protein